MDTIKFEKQQVKMIAHRGLSGIEKENTASAFVAAGNRSYWGIETDVHKTRDGEFIVFHDDMTGRVAGDNVNVEEADLSALRELILYNTGFYFQHSDHDAYSFKDRYDLRIPTLNEYVGICQKYEKNAVIELKNRFTTKDIAKMVDLISDKDYLEHTFFISFVLENLIDLRRLLPGQPLQYLVEQYSDDVFDALQTYRLDLDIHYKALSKEMVDALHREGIKINCWTCDTADEGSQLAQWGVDFITSNILE